MTEARVRGLDHDLMTEFDREDSVTYDALTMNTYSHVAPEVAREAADRIAETLWQTGEDQADEPEADEPEDDQEDGK